MDQKELQNKIAEYYAKLPPKAKEVFETMKWLETLETICAKHGLKDAQIQTIGTETTLLLLGIIHFNEYETILNQELGLPGEEVDRILVEMNELVLKPIRAELADTYYKNSESEEVVKMESDIEQKITDRFAKLPKNIQDIIKETNYWAKLYRIAEEFKLTAAQMDALEGVTTDVIMGSVKPEAFEGAVQKVLNLPTDRTRPLVNKINEDILLEIRRKVMGGGPKDREAEREEEVLKSAGIQIVDNSQVVGKNSAGPTLKDIAPKPIIAEKLTQSVKAEPVQTDHTVENLSKPAAPTPGTIKTSFDPYREKLEQ